MNDSHFIPKMSYGILQQNIAAFQCDEVIEQVKNLGYAILDSGYNDDELQIFSDEFNILKKKYIHRYGKSVLKKVDEYYTIRCPLLLNHSFLKLALNKNLISVLRQTIQGTFILNQQNGIINPSHETYNQARWHRDLPYQHFVSSKPLAINALFCLDDFTADNGATYVLPASHKSESFPSERYIQSNAIQILAKAGSFILLDCMVFHAGGFNQTERERRAINHVYNIPYFKQQINIPKNINKKNLSNLEKEILGFASTEAESIQMYLSERLNRIIL